MHVLPNGNLLNGLVVHQTMMKFSVPITASMAVLNVSKASTRVDSTISLEQVWVLM